jgi:hypothetical protein
MPGANAESRIFVSETETVSNGVLACVMSLKDHKYGLWR